MKKKLLSVLLSIAMLTTSGIATIASAEEADNVIYVSATLGDDANSGTLSAPLKTIDAARLKARELSGNVTVEIMEGDYRLSSTIKFTAEDSNVTYKAYEGAKPEIKGSVLIPTSAAKKVTDDTVLEKMTENAQKEAYVINLENYGITQGMIVDPASANHQYGIDGNVEFNNFFVDGNSLNVAQWPNNKDYAQFNSLKDDTSIVYADDYCDSWAGQKGWWVGLWIPYDYSYFKFAGVSVDAENNVLDYTDSAISKFGKKSDDQYDYRSKRWKAYNLLPEMDVPGEYYIDRDNLELYFYPTSHIGGSELELEVNLKNMIEITEAENITFDGLTFTQTTGNAIYATNIKNVDIRNCTFKDIGMSAAIYRGTTEAATGNKYTDENGEEKSFWQYQKKNGSYDCDIENNVFMNIGSSAISMTGAGDIDTLTSSNNYIKNNILYNISSKSALYGITLGGCGVTFENNNMSKSMVGGIYLYGNNHTIQYNELYNLMAEASDGAAIYQGRADVFRGSKVQYNYIHDAVLDGNKTYAGLENAQVGLYWDDGQTGNQATHNIFANIRTAFNSNHAGDYVHSFNTTVNCEKAWSLIDYPHGEVDVRTQAANGFTLAQLQQLIVYKELYYKEYDNLQTIAEEGTNPRKLNVLEKNLRVNSGESVEPYNEANATFKYNENVGTYEEKVDLTEIFVNPENQDYRVKSGSEFAALGVLNEDFEIELIGIQTDFELNEETATFEKLYPAKNANIALADEYNFTWSDALGANNYKITVAEDEAFEEIVFEKETMQTGAVVTGLSDETVYYWKVEAQNSSRELANTWTTVDGVTSFGVNVSFYNDTEKPEIPANALIDNVLFQGKTYTYQSEWSSANIFSGSDYTNKAREYTWKEDGGTYWKIYPIGFNASSYNDGADFAYEAGKSYVLSAMVTDSSTADNLAPIEFTSALMYTNTAGTTNQYVYSLEAQAGNDYTLTKDWTKYAATILVPEDYASGVTLFTGTRASFEGSVDQHKFKIYGVYLSEEIEYDIEFSGRTLVNANSPTVIDADLVNQGGTVGNLSQEGFSFIALDAERTAPQDGFTLTQDQLDSSKVTVSVDDTVAAGNYIILAENAGIRKGLEIEVVDTFEDIIAEKNANIITKADDVNDLNRSNGAGDMAWVLGNYFRWTEKALGVSNNYASGPTSLQYGKGDLTKALTANTNYVMSVRLKNPTPEIRTPMTFNMSLNYLKTPAVSFSVNNTDYETFTAGFTTTADATMVNMGVDVTIDRTGYTEFGSIDMDISNGGSLYIAEEQAYEIEVSGDGIIVANSPAEFSAEIKNQVGDKYTQNQEIEWIVTDKERTTIQTGFEITGENGNIEVLADDTVESGTYALVAISNGITKGFEIKVLNGFADTEVVEYADNMITDPDNINNFEHNNGTKITRSYASGDYCAWTEQAAAKDGYWGVGSTYLQLSDKFSDLTKSFEKGKRYVMSVRLKNANPDAGETVEFAYGLNYLKEGTINVTSTDYQTYTSEFTASLNSSSLALGFDTKVDRSAYTELASVAMDISNGGSLYVAEEAAAEIKITADNTILTPMDSINVSAEVLNQIGTKGNLSQDVEWYVVSADRKTVIDGAKIEKTETGAIISIEGAIPSGEYAIVAVSDTLIKGVDIKVVANYNDTETPEMNQNLLKDGACSGSGWGNNASWSYTTYADGRNGDAVKVYSTNDIAVADYNTYWYAYGVMPSKLISDDKTSVFEADKNYVLSIWAKDIKESEELPYSKVTMAFMSNKGKSYLDTYPEDTNMTLTDNWQEFKGTFTVPTGYTSYSGLTIGYPTTVETKAGMAMAIDDAYLAEEQVYSIEIMGDSEIAVGGNATYSAKLLNQIGTEGKLSQDFDWMVLNADRTAYAEGITVVENQDGTVTVTGVLEGTYTLLAMSKTYDFIKGYTVTVSEATETPVEKIASAEFTQSGTSVNFKATVENTDAEKVFFVIGEFNGKSLVKTAKSVVKAASDANCDLILENVAVGNTVRAFIWNNGTLLPIDNVENFKLEYVVTE